MWFIYDSLSSHDVNNPALLGRKKQKLSQEKLKDSWRLKINASQ